MQRCKGAAMPSEANNGKAESNPKAERINGNRCEGIAKQKNKKNSHEVTSKWTSNGEVEPKKW